jgi:hypothetical protein
MPLSKYHRLAQIEIDEEVTQQSKRDEKISQILEQSVKYIAKKYITSPTDPKIIAFISTLIENSNFKKYHIDKLQVFIDILKALFPQIDEIALQQSITFLEFMLKKGLIKSIPLLRRAFHLSYELVKDIAVSFFFTN